MGSANGKQSFLIFIYEKMSLGTLRTSNNNYLDADLGEIWNVDLFGDLEYLHLEILLTYSEKAAKIWRNHQEDEPTSPMRLESDPQARWRRLQTREREAPPHNHDLPDDAKTIQTMMRLNLDHTTTMRAAQLWYGPNRPKREDCLSWWSLLSCPFLAIFRVITPTFNMHKLSMYNRNFKEWKYTTPWLWLSGQIFKWYFKLCKYLVESKKNNWCFVIFCGLLRIHELNFT